jgi:hypothetical protein
MSSDSTTAASSIAAKGPAAKWWHLVTPFAAAAVFLAIPFFIRKQVEVRADLVVSEMTFVSESPAPALLGNITSDSVSVSAFREFVFRLANCRRVARPARMARNGTPWQPETGVSSRESRIRRSRSRTPF